MRTSPLKAYPRQSPIMESILVEDKVTDDYNVPTKSGLVVALHQHLNNSQVPP